MRVVPGTTTHSGETYSPGMIASRAEERRWWQRSQPTPLMCHRWGRVPYVASMDSDTAGVFA